MALNFPSSPTDGQIYTDSVSGNRYVYNAANTAWLYSSNTTGGASITGTSNTQVLFNYQDAIAGSNGLTFSSNTLFANTVSIQNTIASINSINFITTNQTADAPNDGEIQWNPNEQTLDIGLANGAILQSGQEVLYYVKNQTGATILEGTVVGAVGTLGSSGRILVAPFKANNQYQSKYCIGVTTTEILNGGEGFVTHFGKVRGLDTSMYSDGQILYANATSAGSFATSLPTAPNNKITLAIVVHSDVNGGVIFVRPTFGSRLAENENLELTAISNGDLLFYNSTTTRFENNPQAAVNAGQLNGITANTIFAHANNSSNSSNLWANTVSGYSNNWANTVAGISNVWANTVAGYSNTWANTVAGIANTWANTQYSNALAYANSVGTGANNQAGLMANASNSASTTRDGYSNNWANTVAGYSNTWANTTQGNAQAYANSVGTAANNQAGLMANAANSSAASLYLPLAGGTITGSLVINQNLTVSGTTTYVNTQSLLIGDSVIVLNADLPSTAVPTENAGIEVNRGNTNSNSAIVWVESAAKWYITSNTWAGNNNWIASNADLIVLGTGANNQAGLMANAANAYSQSLEGVGNNWANTVAGYSNVWANTVSGYSNTWANTQYGNSLTYANAVGLGANNQAGLMANAANSSAITREGYSNNWANTVAGISNNWANTVSGYANNWANTKLSNTSGVSFAGDLYFPTGNVTIGGTTTNYKLQVYGSFAANTKSFVIDHPTKEGMKLRHGSLEGPENGVYVRGKCEGSFEIDLPDYWTGLIDADSITVTLTPYGRKQNLFVRNIANNKVFIYNSDDTLPYCYYLIQAERKDVEKMIVEY